MPLRTEIEAVVRKNAGDLSLAAELVCVLLDNEIGLAGNGWFDDDPVMCKRLGIEEDATDE